MSRRARNEMAAIDGLIGLALLGGITGATLLLRSALDQRFLLSAVALVVGVSICATFVAVLAVARLFHASEHAQHLADHVQRLLDSMEEVEKLRGEAVTDAAIADYESKASVIRVITPDLFSDTRGLYATILNNIRQGKEYRYVIPESAAVLEQMRMLERRLHRELGKRGDESLPLRFKTNALAPIMAEYVLYEFEPQGELSDLMGFVEIKLRNETTNLRLDRHTALSLSCWIDDVVCQHDARAGSTPSAKV